MSYEVTEESFLKDSAGHRMTIIRDDGVHRHIQFKEPGTRNQQFDLITWPGYLCYTGDMGTYVFSRLADMFEFFRTDREYAEKRGQLLSINKSYWAEKLEAVDSSGRHSSGVKEFSPEKFERVVKEQLVSWWRDGGMDSNQRHVLREAIEDQVLSCAHDGDVRAFDAANDFEHEGHQFVDLWDHDLTEYTTRFVWCCYALAWGILQYDESKTDQGAQGEPTP